MATAEATREFSNETKDFTWVNFKADVLGSDKLRDATALWIGDRNVFELEDWCWLCVLVIWKSATCRRAQLWDSCKKLLRIWMLRAIKDLIGASVFYGETVFHNKNLIGHICNYAHIVGNQQDS